MKKYLSMFFYLMVGVSMLTSCLNDDDDNDGEEGVIEYTSNGAFILCEGNYYSGINGELNFLSYEDGSIDRELFKKANGRALGGTPNDALVTLYYIFLTTTDDNLLEVIDKATMKSVKSTTIPSPREMTNDENYIYVTSFDGKVRRIDTSSFSVILESEKIGDNLEGIAYLNGSLYVCNSCTPGETYTYNTEVVKLNSTTLKKEGSIKVNANPTQIFTDGTDLYVCSQGNYDDVSAKVQKIDGKTNAVSDIAPATLITLANKKLYIINAPFGSTATYSIYDIKTGTTSSFIQGDDIFSPCGIAADPLTGDVLISSYKEGDYGYADYNGEGYIIHYDKDGIRLAKGTTGVGPATIVINYQWQYK